jgi:hypothetical protein
MNVTDEMVESARNILDKTYADQDMKARHIIEAAMQAAWVKFDINDKATHPPSGEDVLVDFGGYCVVADLRGGM